MQTAWGDHSLATALRILLLEALKDPLNQRFQLLCPATIPIRPALFTYTQLIAEERSRVGWFWPVRGTLALACRHADSLLRASIMCLQWSRSDTIRIPWQQVCPYACMHAADICRDHDNIESPSGVQRDRNFSDWAWRFPVPMLEEMPEIEGHTRFHRQFLTLSRGHAEVINSDSRIIRLFQRHCFIARET